MNDVPLLSLAIHGAAGRLGAAVLKLALASPACSVVGATVSPGSEQLGRDLGPGEALRYCEVLEPRTMPAETVVLELSRADWAS